MHPRDLAGLGRGPGGGRRAAPRGAEIAEELGRSRRHLPGDREPHDGAGPARPPARGGRRRDGGDRGRPVGTARRRSTATSCAATAPTRCSCSAAGTSRAQLGETALEWSPVGVSFVNAVANLAIVEIEARAGERAGRLLGRLLLELETVPRRPASRAGLSGGGVVRPVARRPRRRAARRGAAAGRRSATPRTGCLVAKMAASVARDRCRGSSPTPATGATCLRSPRHAPAGAPRSSRRPRPRSPGPASPRRSGRAARPTRSSRHGPRLPRPARRPRRCRAPWDAAADRWRRSRCPYQVARARWRQAEAALGAATGGRVGRRAAARCSRPPGSPASSGARPLLRELEELAGRARIRDPGSGRWRAARLARGRRRPSPAWRAPATVAAIGRRRRLARRPRVRRPGPARSRRAFGLSRASARSWLLIAAGRTNREIGEHLFISQKTVGVHVGNILSKLGVSGRVEAAAVAIRLGLRIATDRRPARRRLAPTLARRSAARR